MTPEPPQLAVWLLKRFVTGYRSESLLGDLLEEYESGRTSAWFWRETIAALFLVVMRTARLLYSRRAARVITTSIALCALAVEIERLSQQYRYLCPSVLPLPDSVIVGSCAAVSVTLIAIAILHRSPRHQRHGTRKSTFLRRSIAIFAAVGLGSAALSWASTTSCPAQSQACDPSSAVISCFESSGAPSDGR